MMLCGYDTGLQVITNEGKRSWYTKQIKSEEGLQVDE